MSLPGGGPLLLPLLVRLRPSGAGGGAVFPGGRVRRFGAPAARVPAVFSRSCRSVPASHRDRRGPPEPQRCGSGSEVERGEQDVARGEQAVARGERGVERGVERGARDGRVERPEAELELRQDRLEARVRLLEAAAGRAGSGLEQLERRLALVERLLRIRLHVEHLEAREK
jgi:hypothetical protein